MRSPIPCLILFLMATCPVSAEEDCRDVLFAGVSSTFSFNKDETYAENLARWMSDDSFGSFARRYQATSGFALSVPLPEGGSVGLDFTNASTEEIRTRQSRLKSMAERNQVSRAMALNIFQQIADTTHIDAWIKCMKLKVQNDNEKTSLIHAKTILYSGGQVELRFKYNEIDDADRLPVVEQFYCTNMTPTARRIQLYGKEYHWQEDGAQWNLNLSEIRTSEQAVSFLIDDPFQVATIRISTSKGSYNVSIPRQEMPQPGYYIFSLGVRKGSKQPNHVACDLKLKLTHIESENTWESEWQNDCHDCAIPFPYGLQSGGYLAEVEWLPKTNEAFRIHFQMLRNNVPIFTAAPTDFGEQPNRPDRGTIQYAKTLLIWNPAAKHVLMRDGEVATQRFSLIPGATVRLNEVDYKIAPHSPPEQ